MPLTIELRPDVVEAIFMDCLFKEGEDTSRAIPARGIVNNFGYHPDRLKSHEEEIVALLNELPNEFKKESGGGWSFLNGCMDKHGNQWTGEHRVMDQLFSLGLAINKIELPFPREAWSILPGGMPYYAIL